MRSRLRSMALDACVLVVAAVLTGPVWLDGGYGLARDMLFVPEFALTADALGVGTVLPRAVPLDAVLAAATSVVDGAVVFRVAVVGVLVAAGCGAHRLGARLPMAARVLMAVAAVWNPYVLERLAMGQWALLAGYAALWWLVPAFQGLLRGERGAWPAALWWGVVASLTPTGGLFALGLAVATVVVSQMRSTRRPARCVALLAVALAWQLPWIVPSLAGAGAAVSDAAGVAAFSARSERAGGVVPTLLGTGGIWNPYVVPTTSQTWWGIGLTAAALLALGFGGRRLVQREPGLALAAGTGLLLAALPLVPLGRDLLEAAVVQVPGAGLLRDGHKWLAPYVVALVYAAGIAAGRLQAVAARRGPDVRALVVVSAALVPFILLPDGPDEVWPALRPVHYPAELHEAVSVLSAAPDSSGEVVTLPWTSYRRYPWGNDLSAADPVPRWADHGVVVSDDLAVPGGTVQGEDVRAAEIDRALAVGAEDAAGALAAAGVGWVLVYDDAGPVTPVQGLVTEVSGESVTLYRVPGPVDVEEPAPRALFVLMAALDGVWLAVGVSSGTLLAWRSSRAARRSRGAESSGFVQNEC